MITLLERGVNPLPNKLVITVVSLALVGFSNIVLALQAYQLLSQVLVAILVWAGWIVLSHTGLMDWLDIEMEIQHQDDGGLSRPEE